jgi:hypothetical protein
MEQTPIQTAEMVREIRDRLYEETKQMSREELKSFITRESRKAGGAKKASSSGQSAA